MFHSYLLVLLAEAYRKGEQVEGLTVLAEAFIQAEQSSEVL
jgi:hypothetical protein